MSGYGRIHRLAGGISLLCRRLLREGMIKIWYGFLSSWHFLRAYFSQKPLFLVGCHTGPFAGNAYHFLKNAHRRREAHVVGVVYRQGRYALVKARLPWVPRGSWMARCLAKHADVVLGTGYPYANIGKEAASALQMMMWHGMPIKGIGFQCRPEPAAFPEVDLCLATSSLTADIMGRVFGLASDKVLCTGEPKTDGFVDPDRPDVLKALGGTVRKIVLYAPTYRDRDLQQAGDNVNAALVESLVRSETLKEVLNRHQAGMVIALHPFVRTLLKGSLQPPFYSATKLDVHTEHLMAASSYLISDYSSMVVDWLLLSRPMCLYCPDFAAYKEFRGFPYFDYERLFEKFIQPTVQDVAAALDAGLDAAAAKPDEDLNRLKNLFHRHEAGGASNRIFDWVVDEIIRANSRGKRKTTPWTSA